jgi:hypothetical protein
MSFDLTIEQDSLDYSKIEIVKQKKRTKLLIWMSFLFFGWSYGSLGKPVLQAMWYAITFFSAYQLWLTYDTSEFTEYSSMALVGSVIMIFWFIIRLFTLNRDIRKFNHNLAEFYYLTPQERIEAGIDKPA